ncbi:hypothetical protein WN55_08384 [Dufourea novaeangliae]|uniref:Uncharacterized protein n=1 Tax=Dufourea novaeangliae TaxID=178035 RepID=A0A154P6W9_DUFNO|nr:hypothetical protein WN55_08384 [Dufourea novaeangliae]
MQFARHSDLSDICTLARIYVLRPRRKFIDNNDFTLQRPRRHMDINSGLEQVSGSIARACSIYTVCRRKRINVARPPFPSRYDRPAARQVVSRGRGL